MNSRSRKKQRVLGPPVKFFRENEEYGELSNFWKTKYPLKYVWITFPTSEHMYQYQKFLYTEASEASANLREQIREAKTPYQAKLMASDPKDIPQKFYWQKVIRDMVILRRKEGAAISPAWFDDDDDASEDIDRFTRIDSMRRALREKFRADPHCASVLVGTGDRTLIEASPYDDYWGCVKDGTGQNMLGKLLMQERDHLVIWGNGNKPRQIMDGCFKILGGKIRPNAWPNSCLFALKKNYTDLRSATTEKELRFSVLSVICTVFLTLGPYLKWPMKEAALVPFQSPHFAGYDDSLDMSFGEGMKDPLLALKFNVGKDEAPLFFGCAWEPPVTEEEKEIAEEHLWPRMCIEMHTAYDNTECWEPYKDGDNAATDSLVKHLENTDELMRRLFSHTIGDKVSFLSFHRWAPFLRPGNFTIIDSEDTQTF